MVSAGNEPPAERARRLSRDSARLWFRSSGVALGVLADGATDDAQCWKWNRVEGRFRQWTLDEDDDLGGEVLSRARSAPGFRIVSWKPQSRLAWIERGASPRFVKRYAPRRFQERAAQARAFGRVFGERGAKLLAVDPEERAIVWEFVDVESCIRSPLPADAALELAASERGDPLAEGAQLQAIRPQSIIERVEARLAAHRAWIPLLRPWADRDLGGLEAWWTAMRLKLSVLPPEPPVRPIHGDFRRRNTGLNTRGDFVLIDSDHLARGEVEWDLAAWAAESQAGDGQERFSGHERICGARLALYRDVWRLILKLKAIEDGA